MFEKTAKQRKLSGIRNCLDLLGYNIASIKKMYEQLLQQHESNGCDIRLSFDVFCEVLKSVDIGTIVTVELEEYNEQKL